MTDQPPKEVAERYFEGVRSDLLAYGGVDVKRIEPLRRSLSFAIEVFDEVALLLARRYQNGDIDFEIGDWLANTFNGKMLELMIEMQKDQKTIKWSDKLAEVYDAFDSGEHDHFGRSKEPIAEFTDPLIAEFLNKENGPDLGA